MPTSDAVRRVKEGGGILVYFVGEPSVMAHDAMASLQVVEKARQSILPPEAQRGVA